MCRTLHGRTWLLNVATSSMPTIAAKENKYISVHPSSRCRGDGTFHLLTFSTMKNKIQLPLFILLATLLFSGVAAAQCPQPVNILQNPDFENYGPPCIVPPNTTVEAAFNQGCVQGWQAANQTPSICTTNPASGLLSACLGFAPPNESNYREAIFQDLIICQGENYQLTFSHRALEGNATVDVYMASGLTNVPINDPVGFAINPTWQFIQTINAGNAWQVATLNFTANNLANNQLLFQVTGGGDVVLDNMSMICISQIDPQIAATNLGSGQFNFVGSAPAQPPLAVVNWCWDFGDGSPTVSGANLSSVTHTYATSGNYQVCLTIQDNCCFCLNTICTTVSYDACACGQNPQVLNTGGITNWTGLTQDINNDVIIAPGTDLVITSSTLNIKSPCKFVVMRGASLNVRGSELRTACESNKWGGIIVWGNSVIDHSNPPAGTTFSYINPVNNSANTPGVLLSTSFSGVQSLIRDINTTGIFAQRLASDANEAIYANLTGVPFDPATQLGGFTGGVARCISTIFRDNDLSGDFRDYPFNNYSQFGSCTFTTSVAPADLSNIGPEGVRIWNTDNISFQNCNFDHVGARGIVTVNGSLTMTRCTLNQHYQGLRATSAAGQTGFVQVGISDANQRNRFTDNRYGIYSDGIFNLNVHTNTFENNGDLVDIGGFGFFQGGGIFATGASSFDVLDNDFNGNISGAELLNTSGGGTNGAAANQRFKCNIHEQDRIGMLVRGRCPGMYFKDNAFDNIAADLVLRRNFFTSSEIHLNQGANNAAIFNYFSTNATDIASSTAAGHSVLFNYFPPLVEDPIVFQRATPDCDINGFQAPITGPCTILNNYLNRPFSNGFADPCLPPPYAQEYQPCSTRICLDALRTQKQGLELLVGNGQSQYASELATIKLRFDTDRRDLAWKWYESSYMDSIAQMFTAYGTMEDLQMLYAYHTRAREYTAASALLESLSGATDEDAWFKGVQRIYLKYAQSAGQYTATPTEDQLLESVAITATNPGGHARATYYLLHGIWLEPLIDHSEDEFVEERAQQAQVETLGMIIAPNPASGRVLVTVSDITGGTIRVIDLHGKVAQMLVLQAGTAAFSTSLMPTGMYIVQHLDAYGRTVASQKLVVQH